MFDIALKSLLAAVITAIILIIARFSSPALAGAIGGIPIVFAVSYVLLTLENKAIAKDFLVGGSGELLPPFSLVYFSFGLTQHL